MSSYFLIYSFNLTRYFCLYYFTVWCILSFSRRRYCYCAIIDVVVVLIFAYVIVLLLQLSRNGFDVVFSCVCRIYYTIMYINDKNLVCCYSNRSLNSDGWWCGIESFFCYFSRSRMCSIQFLFCRKFQHNIWLQYVHIY